MTDAQYAFELSKELAAIYKISAVSEAYKRGDLMQKYDMVTFFSSHYSDR